MSKVIMGANGELAVIREVLWAQDELDQVEGYTIKIGYNDGERMYVIWDNDLYALLINEAGLRNCEDLGEL